MAPFSSDYSHVYAELGIFHILFFFWTFLQFVKDIQESLLA